MINNKYVMSAVDIKNYNSLKFLKKKYSFFILKRFLSNYYSFNNSIKPVLNNLLNFKKDYILLKIFKNFIYVNKLIKLNYKNKKLIKLLKRYKIVLKRKYKKLLLKKYRQNKFFVDFNLKKSFKVRKKIKNLQSALKFQKTIKYINNKVVNAIKEGDLVEFYKRWKLRTKRRRKMFFILHKKKKFYKVKWKLISRFFFRYKFFLKFYRKLYFLNRFDDLRIEKVMKRYMRKYNKSFKKLLRKRRYKFVKAYKNLKKFKKLFRQKTALMFFRSYPSNYYITLTDLSYRVIYSCSAGLVNTSHNKKTKTSTVVQTPMFKRLFKYIRRHKIKNLRFEVRNRLDSYAHGARLFFEKRGVSLIGYRILNKNPHNLGQRLKKPRRI